MNLRIAKKIVTGGLRAKRMQRRKLGLLVKATYKLRRARRRGSALALRTFPEQMRNKLSNYHQVLSGGQQLMIAWDLIDWALWWECRPLRQVAHTRLPNGTEVSTICMGIASPTFGAQTHWFESAVNRRKDNGWDTQDSYATLGEARTGHAVIVEKVRAELGPS